jgi:hypothetical protein
VARERLELAPKTSNNLSTMGWWPKSFITFILAAFFSFGILCSALATPGQALASVSDCSQMPGSTAMVGCDHPSYLCGFDRTNNLLSSGALTSPRSADSLKNALGLALGVSALDVSIDLSPPGVRAWRYVFLAESGKVSIRLLNSTLNL